jgi:hypothetical protein
MVSKRGRQLPCVVLGTELWLAELYDPYGSLISASHRVANSSPDPRTKTTTKAVGFYLRE